MKGRSGETGETGELLVLAFRSGARVLAMDAADGVPTGHALLFLLHADGHLAPTTGATGATAGEGDSMTVLGPAPTDT